MLSGKTDGYWGVAIYGLTGIKFVVNLFSPLAFWAILGQQLYRLWDLSITPSSNNLPTSLFRNAVSSLLNNLGFLCMGLASGCMWIWISATFVKSTFLGINASKFLRSSSCTSSLRSPMSSAFYIIISQIWFSCSWLSSNKVDALPSTFNPAIFDTITSF